MDSFQGMVSAELAALRQQTLSWIQTEPEYQSTTTLPVFDENRWLQLARQHRLLPVIARQLASTANTTSSDQSPASKARLLSQLAMRAIEQQAKHTGLKSIVHLGEMLRVVHAFQRENLCVVPFKGPTLAHQAFGDVRLRSSNDLDFLIPADQIGAAAEQVRRLGYRQDREHTPWQLRSLLRHHCAIGFTHPTMHLPLELHWRFAPRHLGFALDWTDLGPRLKDMPCGGSNVTVLPAEEQLVMLLFHAAKHAWLRMNWLLDVVLLLRNEPNLDWSHLKSLAIRWRVRRVTQLGLCLAAGWWSARLPDDLLRWSLTPWSQKMAARVTHGWDVIHQTAPPSGECVRFQLRTLDGFWDQTRSAARLALTPTMGDWDWFPLPSQARAAYYVLRPLRLLVQQGTNLLAHAQGPGLGD